MLLDADTVDAPGWSAGYEEADGAILKFDLRALSDDKERGERIKTVEIAVDRVAWRGVRRSERPATVRFRIEAGEDLLRRAVLLAGGRWDVLSDTWTLPGKAATSLGLNERLRKR